MTMEFWKYWKNKTEIEKRAIDSIYVAQKILFDAVPKNGIYAIYVKGSFVRREMTTKSDVDIVPITYKNSTLDIIQKLEKTKGNLYKPSELLPLSLEEFEQGKRYLKYSTPKGSVDLTLRNLYQFRLIYGKPVNIKKYAIRSDLEFLKGHIKAFNSTFIPLYKENKFEFSQLMKQVFFLVEREERVKGKITTGSWKDLAQSIKDKNHIIHDALEYRLNPTNDINKQSKSLKKLEIYLESLNKYI